jgi:hypothetical protein
MTTKNKPNQAEVVATCTARIKALKANVASTKAVVVLGGVAHKASDVVAIYQACLDNRATLDTQRAEVKATLATLEAADAKRIETERALKPWMINTFGATSKEAHDFGYLPPKKPVQSVDTKAQAKVRREATRAARHTMGPKQKEKIKGTMVVLTAPAAPANTVPAAAPAASAPNATTIALTLSAAPSPQPTVTTPLLLNSTAVAPVTNGVAHS